MHLDGTAERDVHVHFNLIQLDVFLLLPSTPFFPTYTCRASGESLEIWVFWESLLQVKL